MENFKQHQAAATARHLLESEKAYTGLNKDYIGKGKGRNNGTRSPNTSQLGSQKNIRASPKLIMEGVPGN